MDILFVDELGLLEAICLMRLPWQLSATNLEMIAVFPKPTFPTTTASVFCQFCVPQVFFYLVKEPIPSHKHRVCGYAWYFKQQWFQQNVLWLVGSKSCFGKKKKKIIILEECHNFMH